MAEERLSEYYKEGVKKAMEPNSPKGTANHNKYGLNLPHLLVVLSAKMPMMGSKTVSHMRVIKIMVPATAAEMPKISV